MTMTAEQARDYILELVDWEETNGYKTSDLVMEWGNVNADIDEHGNVWVWGDKQDRGTGRWLGDISLFEFVAWHLDKVK